MLLIKLAFRNIFRQRRRSLLTALSLTGGYVLSVFSISMQDGSYANAIAFFTEDHSGHVQIHKDDYLDRAKIHKTIDNPNAIATILDKHPSIASYTTRVFAPALSYSDDGNTPVQLIGVDVLREKQTSRLYQKITDGNYFADSPNDDGYFSAMIGAGVANALEVGLGDELILISQGADGSIANDIFIVSAIVGENNSPDKNTVFLPLSGAQSFLTMYGKVHQFSILLTDISDAREVATELQSSIPSLSVAPWQVVESSFYKTMQADREGNLVMLVIIGIIVFIGVLNTVLMSVLERSREFGVLKAMGSRPSKIVSMITLEVTMLSAMSIVLGLALAIPLTYWFSTAGIELPEPVDVGGIKMSRMTGLLTPTVFIIPMIGIFFAAIVVSIFPGLRAANVTPTAAMRSH
mgnify:CR=1 FL=1|jgi:putative ABC transport system permease protein|tara:strand:+ start:2354 stop:3574 length:1221 start_codon:yes stop_codon:yes gene_type:complete